MGLLKNEEGSKHPSKTRQNRRISREMYISTLWKQVKANNNKRRKIERKNKSLKIEKQRKQLIIDQIKMN